MKHLVYVALIGAAAAQRCEDDLSYGDSAGDYCDDYWGNESWCGNYDTDDFNSWE